MTRLCISGLRWAPLAGDTQCVLSRIITGRSEETWDPLGGDSQKLCVWNPSILPLLPLPPWGHLEGSQGMLHRAGLNTAEDPELGELSSLILEGEHAYPESSLISQGWIQTCHLLWKGSLLLSSKVICYRRVLGKGVWSKRAANASLTWCAETRDPVTPCSHHQAACTRPTVLSWIPGLCFVPISLLFKIHWLLWWISFLFPDSFQGCPIQYLS